jgi:hypothetical protein
MTNDSLTFEMQDGIQCNSNDWHIGGDEVRLTTRQSRTRVTNMPCNSSPTTARTSVVLRVLRPTRVEAIRGACDQMRKRKVFTVLTSLSLIQ